MTKRAYKSGQDREPASLLPPRIEDYVGPDNPVRATDAYVEHDLLLNEYSVAEDLGPGHRRRAEAAGEALRPRQALPRGARQVDRLRPRPVTRYKAAVERLTSR
jgi:hypothetical protein